jgi:hypothetical protein
LTSRAAPTSAGSKEAWDQGRAFSLDEAIAYALQDEEPSGCAD